MSAKSFAAILACRSHVRFGLIPELRVVWISRYVLVIAKFGLTALAGLNAPQLAPEARRQSGVGRARGLPLAR
jgi:hypothetical protein